MRLADRLGEETGQPANFLQGEKDGVTPPKGSADMATKFPNVRRSCGAITTDTQFAAFDFPVAVPSGA